MLNKKGFTTNNSNNKILNSTNISFSNIEIRDSLNKKFKNLNKIKGFQNSNGDLNKLKSDSMNQTNEIFELIKPKYFINKNNDFSSLFSRFQNLVKKNKVNQSNSSSLSKFNNIFMNNSFLSSEDDKNNFITKSYYPNISNYNFYSSLINNNHFILQKQKKKRKNNSMNVDNNSMKKLKTIYIDSPNKSIAKPYSKNIIKNKESIKYIFSNKEIQKFKKSKIKNKNEKKNSLNIINILNININIPKTKLQPKTIFDLYKENAYFFKIKNKYLKLSKSIKY
jgi:hypothetical protein